MKHISVRLFLCLFSIALKINICAQQHCGCTDVFADNYDPDALCDDGSCSYASLLYTPRQLAVLPDELRESSGLVFCAGRLWSHNDSGGAAVLYALDTTDFHVTQRLHLVNAKNKDWEDICADEQWLYVGDFGNNKGNRKNLRIYRLALEHIPDSGDAALQIDTIKFCYADQTNFEKRRDHDYDCEALFVTRNYLYLLTKNWQTQQTRLYRLPKTPGEYRVEPVSGFDCKGLITGADYNPKTNMIVIVGYKDKVWEPFMYFIYDLDEVAIKAHGRRIDMPRLIGTQLEGIAFVDDHRLLLSAEKSPLTTSASIFVVDLDDIDHLQWLIGRGLQQVECITASLDEDDMTTIMIEPRIIKRGKYRLMLLDSDGNVVMTKGVCLNSHDSFSLVAPTALGMVNYVVLLGRKKSYIAPLK